MAASSPKKKYSAADIEVLEGLEPVRRRPGMYIAGTDTPAGLHQLAFEILDNSVDEAMNGHASQIELVLHEDGESISVSDNGRGIPVDKHPKFKKSALELILTTLHAGGKFSDKNYKTAGGLHGVGSSVVNALSEQMIAKVKRGGKEYQQEFSRGQPQTKLKQVRAKVKGSGTEIFFRPDPDIFPKVNFSPKILRDTIQTKAYLNPGLKIVFNNKKEGDVEEFCYEDGIVSYLKQLIEQKKLELIGSEPFYLEKEEEIAINLAFCWTQSTKEQYLSYANGIFTEDGGSHENGFKSGIVKAVRNYINVHSLLPKGVKLTSDDIREGMLALISVKLPGDNFQAQFQGQTKSKLNNPEVAPLVESAVRVFEQTLNENPSTAKVIVDRTVMAAKARAASRAAAQGVRRKVGISHRLTLPGKLADCSSIKPDETELFIVEGDSAGGSAKQARKREVQAVLPLRGKVLNTVASGNKKVADNKELSNIISALGCGVGDNLDINKLRYGKVIILTDADADGMHIATLLIAFFFLHMRPLIESGSLYLGKPPLFGIFPRGVTQSGAKGKSGKKNSSPFWVYSEEERDRVIQKNKLKEPRVMRYKGLGEMNPKTLWETTLDPETRTILRVTIEDEDFVMQSLKALMGSDSSARYDLIQSYAEKIEVDV